MLDPDASDADAGGADRDATDDADDGSVTSIDAAIDAPGEGDSRRKYFTLTALGRRAAAAEARRLDGLVRAARRRKLYPQRA